MSKGKTLIGGTAYTIKSGKSSVADRDVYVVATNTNNVYYLKGFKYKGKVYYTF